MDETRTYVVTRIQEVKVHATSPAAAISIADQIWDADESEAFLVSKIRTTDTSAREDY